MLCPMVYCLQQEIYGVRDRMQAEKPRMGPATHGRRMQEGRNTCYGWHICGEDTPEPRSACVYIDIHLLTYDCNLHELFEDILDVNE